MTVEVEIKDGFLAAPMPDFKDGKYEIKIESLDTRTKAQNSALWMWFTMIANQFNHNNVTMDMVLRMDTDWNKDKVKINTFDEIIKKQFNKTSSTQLSKEEFSFALELMIKVFAMRGVTLPEFPTIKVKEEK